MKRTDKSFKKFSSRSKARERSHRELMKIVEETNVGARALKINFTDEPYGRGSQKGKDIFAEGVFRDSAAGYGFVSVEGETRDVFIPESQTLDAIDGDKVKIRYHKFLSGFGEEKTEGRILEVLEVGRKTVIGTVESDVVRIHKRRINRLYLIPDDVKISKRIFLRFDGDARVGDKVMAKLIRGTGYSSYTLEADVISNFGKSESREANYLAILADCEIDTDFTDDELNQAKEASLEKIDTEGRTVRDEIIFTIDSESAKDLDDAISLTVKDDGTYTLGVHIADVSHYIKEKTALDRLVMARGTSVYFTDKVVPMLPPSLSNGACSLNPGEKKYTLSALIELDASANILSVKIEPSVIVSRVKGIYSEINRIFNGAADSYIKEKYADCLDTLSCMHSLYEKLLEKSHKRGAVELESAEAEILLDESGVPVDIIKRERGDAEKMIEQFMLTANEAVATLMLNEGIPCVYRVHEPPPADKFSDFLSYAANLGFDTRSISAENPEPKALAALIEKAKLKGIGEAVSYACLRSMSKAAYSEIHRSHFGLGIENYCHFTSPIRRLSDLATHRIIHKVILEGKPREKFKSYAKRAAAAATEGELRALSAERRIENLYKVIYMRERVGEVFTAMITSVTSFGLFATLENTCEGLIPISTIDGSFVFDEKNITLRNDKTYYRIGDMIRVKLEEADIMRGKLRFSLVTEENL